MLILTKVRKQKGVTLIELAVVMAIVGIMALFVAPAIREWVDNFRIRQAAREMSSDLQLAKMKSISSGVRYTVVFKHGVGDAADSYVVFPDYNNNMVLDNVDQDFNGDGKNENETIDILKSVSFWWSSPDLNISFDTDKGAYGGIDFPPAGDFSAVTFNRSGLPLELSGGQPSPVTADRSIYLHNTKNNKHLKVTVSPSGRIGINEY